MCLQLYCVGRRATLAAAEFIDPYFSRVFACMPAGGMDFPSRNSLWVGDEHWRHCCEPSTRNLVTIYRRQIQFGDVACNPLCITFRRHVDYNLGPSMQRVQPSCREMQPSANVSLACPSLVKGHCACRRVGQIEHNASVFELSCPGICAHVGGTQGRPV